MEEIEFCLLGIWEPGLYYSANWDAILQLSMLHFMWTKDLMHHFGQDFTIKPGIHVSHISFGKQKICYLSRLIIVNLTLTSMSMTKMSVKTSLNVLNTNTNVDTSSNISFYIQFSFTFTFRLKTTTKNKIKWEWFFFCFLKYARAGADLDPRNGQSPT